MALSSAKVSVDRDKSPSRSPLSPTIIDYRQKHQISKVSHDYQRQIRRHHHLQKQQIQNTSQQHHQNQRINRICTRRQSPVNSLWEVHKSSNGQIYYYNVVTDQSQWEKPPRKQLLSSITKKSIHSKRTSNKNNDLFVQNQYHSRKSNRSTSNSLSDNDLVFIRSQSIHIHHRSIKNTNRIKTTTTNNHHHKRKKDNIEIKSSLKKFRKDKRKTDEVVLSTPTSPPANEIIQIDLVDPIPTPNNSNTHISMPFIDPQQQQSHYPISLISLNESKVKVFNSKRSIKTQINEDLSSMISQSSLCPSESTVNAILELEHSSPTKQQCSSPILSTTTNSNSDHITRYYRAELIEHLLNWPSTHIERDAIRLSNEQIRFTTCQLTSLRTDLFSIRLQFERNRFHLLKYHYTLVNQQDLFDKLQLIDSVQL